MSDGLEYIDCIETRGAAMPKYFRGDVNHLSPTQARQKYPAGSLILHLLCSDGTVRVIFLNNQPLYPGQRPFKNERTESHA